MNEINIPIEIDENGKLFVTIDGFKRYIQMKDETHR